MKVPIKLNGYSFEGPYSSVDYLEDRSGVYAVLCRNNEGKYRTIDVGEAGQVKTRVQNHERTSCWTRNCKQLSYAAHYTPNKQQAGRREIEQDIRKAKRVPCGEQ